MREVAHFSYADRLKQVERAVLMIAAEQNVDGTERRETKWWRGTETR